MRRSQFRTKILEGDMQVSVCCFAAGGMGTGALTILGVALAAAAGIIFKSLMQKGGGLNKDINTARFWMILGIRVSMPIGWALAGLLFVGNIGGLIRDQLQILYELHDGLAQIGDENGAKLFAANQGKLLDDKYKAWEKKFEEFIQHAELDDKKMMIEESAADLLLRESKAIADMIDKQVARLERVANASQPNAALDGLVKQVKDGYKSRYLGEYIFEKMPAEKLGNYQVPAEFQQYVKKKK